jgi:hypothetical protein
MPRNTLRMLVVVVQLHHASMRPRRDASEYDLEPGSGAEGSVASMRPRRDASEYTSDAGSRGTAAPCFNEAEA